MFIGWIRKNSLDEDINKALENSSSISENTYLKFLKINLKDDYIRYKKNITGIRKTTDPRSICTRLYLYGKILEDGTKLNIKNLYLNRII